MMRVWAVGRWPWGLVAFLLFAGVGLGAFVLPPTLLAALLAAGAAVLAWLAVPEAVIVSMLLLRSSVDGFMDLFTLFAGSPLSMNLSGAINSLAVGLGILALVRRLVRHQPLFVAAPGWTFGLFLLACLLSIPGSVDPAAGIKEWARLASGLAIYLLVADRLHDRQQGERQVGRFIVIIMIASLLPIATGWLQKLTGSGYFFLGFVGTEFAHRPQGTFSHPAALGSYLVLLLTLAAILYFSTAAAEKRLPLLLWAGTAAGCLLLTLARTQWLGMMVAVMTVGLFKRRQLALAALAGALILLFGVPLLRERLVASDSVLWRVDLWQAGLTLAWPPTLLGTGLATSPWHINQLLPKVDAPPHNDYLKVAIELGVAGLVAYAVWLFALGRHAWRAYRRARQPAIAWRALGLLAVVLAGASMSATDNYMGYTAVQWYLWTWAALVPVDGCWCMEGVGKDAGQGTTGTCVHGEGK